MGTGLNKSSLETLKALRESVANRWEKRREYEWKLSFALWTAIAAFIAIVIGKDISIKMNAGVEMVVAICGGAITLLHYVYLLGIIKNTLNDLDKLKWVEEAMRGTLPAGLLESDAEIWSFKLGRFGRNHGFLQAFITAVLCAGAFFAIMAPRADKPTAATTSPTTSTIREGNPSR
jgi:hypothetical protein